MSGMPDSSPSSGSKSKGGKTLKNVDGREGGEKYNKQDKAAFDPKLTFSPNEDVKQLNGGKNRPGKEEGAY